MDATSPARPTGAPVGTLVGRWDALPLGADTRTMLRLTLATLAATAGLIVARGLVFPLSDVWQPLGVCTLLVAMAAFYQSVRPAPNFVLVLKSLAFLVGFSTVYTMLMYALATGGRPLADPLLAQADGLLGLSAPAVVTWVNDRPTLALVMRVIYFSLIPQTILAIVWLGLSNDREHLDKFLVQFMLASLITAMGFALWPAKGTYGEVYQLPTPEFCVRCAADLDALRSGARTLITWRGTEGLITFPSFHTIWAVLLIAAFSGRKALFAPIAILNLLVVVSTVTTGMHYFTDVLAGLAVTAFVVWATPLQPEKARAAQAAAHVGAG